VNLQTQSTLKQDIRLKQPTSSFPAPGSLSWLETHRAQVIRASVAIAVVALLALAGVLYAQNQSAKADAAFSQAMDIYDTPLTQPGQPTDPDSPSYATAAARAKAANPLFVDVAEHYGLFKAGVNARYFAGITFEDMGQNDQAEAALKKVADSRDAGVAALAKMALASLYHQTRRDADAVSLYQQLIAKPTLTVPVSAAKLQLAELYESSRPEEARKLYAQIKDADKTSAAAEIATKKLDAKK
jgi:tetratricopeptide (TPR) repeat protein